VGACGEFEIHQFHRGAPEASFPEPGSDKPKHNTGAEAREIGHSIPDPPAVMLRAIPRLDAWRHRR